VKLEGVSEGLKSEGRTRDDSHLNAEPGERLLAVEAVEEHLSRVHHHLWPWGESKGAIIMIKIEGFRQFY
jgi:hypothetical protein